MHRLDRLLADALDAATPTLRELARRAGLGYHAIRRYRLGGRIPETAVLRRLARVLRDESAALARWAGRIERLANHHEDEGRKR